MRNIKINEAESIFELFYDGGDSYPNHQKYSCLSEYTVESNESGKVEQIWSAANVVLYGSNNEKTSLVSIERLCRLDISHYDTIRLFASISKDILFRIICCVDGMDVEVICEEGQDTVKEYNGNIAGKYIEKIRMEFENMCAQEKIASLIWMGLSDSCKEKQMLQEENGYDHTWEGCFCDNPVLMPQTGLYFDEEGLEKIRKKIQSPSFGELMNELRAGAAEAMLILPEKEIGTFVHRNERRFVRDRDFGRHCLLEHMEILAFVGIVDEDLDMLKMACRMALSVAHSQYFCESIMGVMPGATWHHRSFTEEAICKALIKVLEWAGGLLTWHGKNIIYDSIIIKGLPRLDADIKTMDYMWKMNQGPVFASALVIVNMALQKHYPRYGIRVEEAEKDMLSMWEAYVHEDGGTAEGPGYWNYTMYSMLEALFLLARYYGQSIEEYVPESIRKSAGYAQALLSDAGDFYVPINDAHTESMYLVNVLDFMAQIKAGKIWKRKTNLALDDIQGLKGNRMNLLIFGQRYEDNEKHDEDEFASFPITGHTTVRRNTQDLGRVGFHVISGLITFGHAHGDKGSFILEAGGRPLLIDRGVSDYHTPYVTSIANSELHNVLTVVRNGKHACQDREHEELSAVVTESVLEDGVFRYATDITKCWKGEFVKNVRRIYSPSPYQYEIVDIAALHTPGTICFILNTYGEIEVEANQYLIRDGGMKLQIRTKNWKPDKIEYGEHGTDGNGKSVNRLCLYVGGSDTYSLCTELLLTKETN